METTTVLQITENYNIKTTIMVYLNFNNLDAKTQNHLLSVSKEDIESKFGDDIKAYAKEHYLNYDDLLEEEATRNLYNYKYVFNI